MSGVYNEREIADNLRVHGFAESADAIARLTRELADVKADERRAIERCEALERLLADTHETATWARQAYEEVRAERDKAIAERDKAQASLSALLRLCITKKWRTPVRTLANADDSGVYGEVYMWWFNGQTGIERTESAAMAAVRKAAGPGEGN